MCNQLSIWSFSLCEYRQNQTVRTGNENQKANQNNFFIHRMNLIHEIRHEKQIYTVGEFLTYELL